MACMPGLRLSPCLPAFYAARLLFRPFTEVPAPSLASAPPRPSPQISEEAKDCVRRMLEPNPAKRATAQEILQVGGGGVRMRRPAAQMSVGVPVQPCCCSAYLY